MSRLRVLAAAAVAAAFVAAPARAEVDWRQFEGTTLNAAYFTANYIDAWFRPMAKRFQEETGIKVQMQVLQAGQIRKKQDIMLAGQDPQLDIVMLQMDNRGGKLTAAGHLEDLQPYLDDPTLTPADYDYPGDWLGGCLNTERVITGQPLNNIVWSAQAQLLHIRRDLFEEHNVKVPTTMAELEDAAKKLTIDEDGDGTPEVYGFLSRGHGRLTTASFATYLFNHGGSWFKRLDDGTKVSNLDSKESIDAFEFYGRLIRDYAPKSALSNKPPQNAALYAAGKAAMLSALNFWHGLADNPKKSRIAGKSTTILVPAGPGRQLPQRADHVARDLQVLHQEEGGVALHRVDDPAAHHARGPDRGGPHVPPVVVGRPHLRRADPGVGRVGEDRGRLRHRHRQAAGDRHRADA